MAITELYGSNDRNAVPDVASGYTPRDKCVAKL